MIALSLQSLKCVLGGTISGKELLCPGPGHSQKDRSLSITLSYQSPDGFICYSHAGDDWRLCREYVLQRLGITRQQSTATAPPTQRPARRVVPDDGEQRRCAAARRLWDEAQ
jgi:hypothetical protein